MFKLENGRLPTSNADEQEVARIATKMTCDELIGQIRDSVRDRQMHRLGVSVSQTESDEYLKEYLDQRKRQLDALNEAAFEIVDQKQDPERVYEKLIAPLGLPTDRRTNLRNVYSPPARAKLAKDAAVAANATVEDAKKAPGQPIVRLAVRVLEERKLNDAIDSQLAAEDPLFRSYLDEWRRGFIRTPTFQTAPTNMPREHLSYLAQKRMQFWQAAYTEVPITLQDPAFANECQLGKAAHMLFP